MTQKRGFDSELRKSSWRRRPNVVSATASPPWAKARDRVLAPQGGCIVERRAGFLDVHVDMILRHALDDDHRVSRAPLPISRDYIMDMYHSSFSRDSICSALDGLETKGNVNAVIVMEEFIDEYKRSPRPDLKETAATVTASLVAARVTSYVEASQSHPDEEQTGDRQDLFCANCRCELLSQGEGATTHEKQIPMECPRCKNVFCIKCVVHTATVHGLTPGVMCPVCLTQWK